MVAQIGFRNVESVVFFSLFEGVADLVINNFGQVGISPEADLAAGNTAYIRCIHRLRRAHSCFKAIKPDHMEPGIVLQP
ncbi:hypothetical protein P2G85_17680 [Vibrio sp. CAU 1672]|nr:hypothetical protein [Vibrio sp. CAU 1672]